MNFLFYFFDAARYVIGVPAGFLTFVTIMHVLIRALEEKRFDEIVTRPWTFTFVTAAILWLIVAGMHGFVEAEADSRAKAANVTAERCRP